MHDLDEFIQQLILAALNITTHLLRPGATSWPRYSVARTSPCSTRSSTASSTTSPVPSHAPHGTLPLRHLSVPRLQSSGRLLPSLLEPLLDSNTTALQQNRPARMRRGAVRRLRRLSGFDADQSYPLQLEGEAPYEHRQPVAAPLSASYIDAVRKKRGANAVGAGGVDEAAIPTAAPTAAAQESWRQGSGCSGNSEIAATADAAAISSDGITSELNGTGCALVAAGIASAVAIATILTGKRR